MRQMFSKNQLIELIKQNAGVIINLSDFEIPEEDPYEVSIEDMNSNQLKTYNYVKNLAINNSKILGFKNDDLGFTFVNVLCDYFYIAEDNWRLRIWYPTSMDVFIEFNENGYYGVWHDRG